MEAMLDSGAGLNTIPEDALVEIINANEKAGVKMCDEAAYLIRETGSAEHCGQKHTASEELRMKVG